MQKTASFCTAITTSCIKGHHHYNYKYQVCKELKCLEEPDIEFSKHTILENIGNEENRIAGRMPDVLYGMMLEDTWETSSCSRRNHGFLIAVLSFHGLTF